MIIREGAQVSYVGYGETGLVVGDQGRVLAASGDASHVRWTSGARKDLVLLVPNEDLVQARAAREVETDLGTGPLVAIAVRETYDDGGEIALFNEMAEAGHLAAFSQIAVEALEWVQGKIANDPSVAEVLGHLDPSEATDLLGFMTTALLRDAFSGEDS